MIYICAAFGLICGIVIGWELAGRAGKRLPGREKLLRICNDNNKLMEFLIAEFPGAIKNISLSPAECAIGLLEDVNLGEPVKLEELLYKDHRCFNEDVYLGRRECVNYDDTDANCMRSEPGCVFVKEIPVTEAEKIVRGYRHLEKLAEEE